MTSIDVEYFRSRALVERHLADFADSENTADARRQMADAYEALVIKFEQQSTLSIVAPIPPFAQASA